MLDRPMVHSAAHARNQLHGAVFVLLVAAIAVGCGATPSAAPSGAPTPRPTAAASPRASEGDASPGASPPRVATPRPSAATTPKTFWTAATRGLTAARHVAVTIAGPNPGLMRFEPGASATVVDGKLVFICVGGAAYDKQSGFARIAGAWQCGASALTSGFRRIGQPAVSWSGSSPSDGSITETITRGTDGTLTWAYTGVSPFLGGRVTARVRLDPASGRILAARRTDPLGATTYTFDYDTAFPKLAVPAH